MTEIPLVRNYREIPPPQIIFFYVNYFAKCPTYLLDVTIVVIWNKTAVSAHVHQSAEKLKL